VATHVCLITNRHWLFDGRVINHAHALRTAGFQVTIADCGRPPEWYRARQGSADPARYLPSDCVIRRIGDPTGALPPAVQRMVRRQCRWWLHRSRIRQLTDIGASIYQAPDLLTARYSQTVAARTGARMIYDIRDLYSAEWEGTNPSRVRRRSIAQEANAIRRADVRLTVCSGLAKLVAERYALPPPHVIRSCRDPVPADCTATDIRSALGVSPDTPLLVHTGHSERGRALDELVDLARSLPEIHLALVGQQEGAVAVQSAAADRSLSARVHVLPALPAPEVSAFIRTADAAVIYLRPVSLNMRYALPNKFFEAVAAGLPLAISEGDEFRPLVQQYGLGVLFDPADSAAARAAVTAVLRENRRYRNAVAAATRELSWHRESVAYLRIYESLDQQAAIPAAASAV
jgi:glycosyltransferase involved in cell wall biosynthesis